MEKNPKNQQISSESPTIHLVSSSSFVLHFSPIFLEETPKRAEISSDFNGEHTVWIAFEDWSCRKLEQEARNEIESLESSRRRFENEKLVTVVEFWVENPLDD